MNIISNLNFKFENQKSKGENYYNDQGAETVDFARSHFMCLMIAGCL